MSLLGGEEVDSIDLKSREVFSHEGRGVAAVVEEDNLQIRQVGLEPEIPLNDLRVHDKCGQVIDIAVRPVAKAGEMVEAIPVGDFQELRRQPVLQGLFLRDDRLNRRRLINLGLDRRLQLWQHVPFQVRNYGVRRVNDHAIEGYLRGPRRGGPGRTAFIAEFSAGGSRRTR